MTPYRRGILLLVTAIVLLLAGILIRRATRPTFYVSAAGGGDCSSPASPCTLKEAAIQAGVQAGRYKIVILPGEPVEFTAANP